MASNSDGECYSMILLLPCVRHLAGYFCKRMNVVHRCIRTPNIVLRALSSPILLLLRHKSNLGKFLSNRACKQQFSTLE